MKRHLWFANLIMAVLVVSCAKVSDQQQAQSPSGNSVVPVSNAGIQSFPGPVVSPSVVVPVPKTPGLLATTNAKSRLPGGGIGRRDPFAAIAPAPIILPAQPQGRTSLRSLPTPVKQLPTFNVASLPTIPIAPTNVTALPPLNPGSNTLPLPTVAAPVLQSPTAIAEAIQITGVLQVQGRWSIIVKEPGSQTSRYVSAGDRLANGKVLVKQIISRSGSDPVVILQQNGVNVTKSLGSFVGSLANNR